MKAGFSEFKKAAGRVFFSLLMASCVSSPPPRPELPEPAPAVELEEDSETEEEQPEETAPETETPAQDEVMPEEAAAPQNELEQTGAEPAEETLARQEEIPVQEEIPAQNEAENQPAVLAAAPEPAPPAEPEPRPVLPPSPPPEPPVIQIPVQAAPLVPDVPPALPAPPIPVPAVPEPPPPTPEPVALPPAPEPSKPAAPPPPALPPFLRPAEEERSPALTREPSPLPALEPSAAIVPLPGARDEEILFSRTVRAVVGQLVEIPFQGSNWVYLGELGAQRGVVYDSRRSEPEGQTFIFRTASAGIYTLKFSRQDFIRDFMLNDHVQVIVGEAPDRGGAGWFSPPDQGRVRAEPRWPGSLEEAALRNGGSAGKPAAVSATDAPPASGQAMPSSAFLNDAGKIPVPSQTEPEESGRNTGTIAPEPAAAVSENQSAKTETQPEDFLQRAQEEFKAGKVAPAIAWLDKFRDSYPAGSDEAWWLYGQFYEANSPNRDILAALDYYRRLIREFPQSSRCDDARKRIAYLQRYYINIQ